MIRAIRIRPPLTPEIPALEAFIASYATDGTLLPRDRSDLLEHRLDFRVAVWSGMILGCGALHALEPGLGEIRSLAVDPSWQGLGLGRRLIRSLAREARQRGVARLRCRTRCVGFFERHGFVATAAPDQRRKTCMERRVSAASPRSCRAMPRAPQPR